MDVCRLFSEWEQSGVTHDHTFEQHSFEFFICYGVWEIIVCIQFNLDEFVTTLIWRSIQSKYSNPILNLITVISSISGTCGPIYFIINLDFLFYCVWLLIAIDSYLSFAPFFWIPVDIKNELHVNAVMDWWLSCVTSWNTWDDGLWAAVQANLFIEGGLLHTVEIILFLL